MKNYAPPQTLTILKEENVAKISKFFFNFLTKSHGIWMSRKFENQNVVGTAGNVAKVTNCWNGRKNSYLNALNWTKLFQFITANKENTQM